MNRIRMVKFCPVCHSVRRRILSEDIIQSNKQIVPVCHTNAVARLLCCPSFAAFTEVTVPPAKLRDYSNLAA